MWGGLGLRTLQPLEHFSGRTINDDLAVGDQHEALDHADQLQLMSDEDQRRVRGQSLVDCTEHKRLGIDVTVSQTNYILSIIEQAIPERSFVHLLNLRFADLAIVEARVPESSPVAHRALGEIDLPDNSVIAAVARDSRLFVPSRATELLPGDDLIAITQPDQEDALRRLLGCEPAA